MQKSGDRQFRQWGSVRPGRIIRRIILLHFTERNPNIIPITDGVSSTDATDDQRAQGCAWEAGRTTAQGEGFQGTRYRCVCGEQMFRVGADKWSLGISNGPIIVGGVACDGACDEHGHRLKICHRLPAEKRLHVLLHELAHAQIYATGYPSDVESLCDFVATVGEVAIRDLTACGGEEMLKRLRPGEVLKGGNGRIGTLRTRTCGQCFGTVAPENVQYQADGDGVLVMAYCDHCGISVKWRERATFGGAPSGEVLGEPVIESGRTF